MASTGSAVLPKVVQGREQQFTRSPDGVGAQLPRAQTRDRVRRI